MSEKKSAEKVEQDRIEQVRLVKMNPLTGDVVSDRAGRSVTVIARRGAVVHYRTDHRDNLSCSIRWWQSWCNQVAYRVTRDETVSGDEWVDVSVNLEPIDLGPEVTDVAS